MKYFILIALAMCMFSCGSAKPDVPDTSDNTEEYSLPPNTASNKYSKKRKGSGL